MSGDGDDMLTTIAQIAAFLMWFPGVGISAYGDKMLSPYEIFILMLLPVIVLTSFDPRRFLFGLFTIAVFVASWANSIDRGSSTLYLVYYLLIITPHMLLSLQIFQNDEAAKAFISTYVRTGVWLGPLAVIEFLSPVQITLTNNTNYAIQTGLHRTQLFCPEASILAALYVVALCITIFNSFKRAEASIPGDKSTYFWLIVGLATTVSTSAVAVLPPLLFYTLRICGIPWRTLVKYAAVSLLLLVIFYFTIYGNRINSGDSTSSTLLRLASMVAGGEVVLQHGLTGLGLGMNKRVADAVKLIYFAWTHNVVDKPGIDSFQLSLTAEMGLSPGIVSVAILVYCYRALKRRIHAQAGLVDLLAVATICLWLVSMLTSGYRGLVYCWLIFPMGVAVFLRRDTKLVSVENRPTPSATMLVGQN
jgi:hypothetical protein